MFDLIHFCSQILFQMNIKPFLIIVLALFIVVLSDSCKKKKKKKGTEVKQPMKERIKMKKVKVLRKFEHSGDRTYTQGLEIHNGVLYESTGLDNISSVKKIDPGTGALLQSQPIKNAFAEGLTVAGGKVFILTYRRGVALNYDTASLEETGIAFSYKGEGWGLTNDGNNLIISDGSEKLFFRDLETFQLTKTLTVQYNSTPQYFINELEYVDGKIYANVYGRPYILAIDPKTGHVLEDIDASAVSCSNLSKSDPEAVLNGIAYNPESGTFFITGKRCPYIYEVTFEF